MSSIQSSADEAKEKEIAALFSKAIEDAFSNAKGWGSEAERENYIKQLVDNDEYLPPLFCETEEELAKSGLKEAFSTLLCDEPPSMFMLDFKRKGNESFVLGKKNLANNNQYYRDAVNHYYQAIAWAEKVECVAPDFVKAEVGPESEVVYFTEEELQETKSMLYANAAMAHMQLKNWGHCKDDATKALKFNNNNVKAWYRLAKAHQMLLNWEEAGDAIDLGLQSPGEENNADLKKLQSLLEHRIRRARQDRQKRERGRAERVAKVKEVWKHCKESNIRLGRVALVSSVSDADEEVEDGTAEEFRWHFHHPHTGKLPQVEHGKWSWPCMFVYPSHRQSDFIEHFGENEMFALRMAQLFPEVDEHSGGETVVPWDYNNEFTCSKLAIYFEVNCADFKESDVVHPESVEPLKDQASTMKFYEASRALRGDEGPEMANLAQAVERKHLFEQRKGWKKKHGSLWAKPDPCPVVRVHPAVTLRDVLVDERMVVPSFLPTFVMIPEDHPVHEDFLKEHKCVGSIQPKDA